MALKQWLGAVILMTYAALVPSHASEITFNGFASVIGGMVIDGEEKSFNEYQCPCAISDYPFVGVYGEDLTFDQDTTIGFQTNFTISENVSATVQLVSHGANEFNVGAEWAYVSLAASDTWTIQAGRKRLPLFYYSDFFDVGYAYTWVRAPADLYGWQIVGYEGMNALYNGNWGSWTTTFNIWAGRDDDNKNRMLSKLYCSYRDQNDELVVVDVDESWKNMTGAYLDLNNDWVTIRFVHMKNEVSRVTSDDYNCGDKNDLGQEFSGIALNVDWNNVIIRTEYNTFERPDEENKYTASLFGLGYRAGDWTPMLTYSEFEEEAALWEAYVERHNTKTFTLRWDFTPSVAFKFQYDEFSDESADLLVFAGDSTLVSFGFDSVF